MNKIVRWYNQNRKVIFITIGIIVFLFGLLQLLNNMSKNNLENKEKNKDENTILLNQNNELISDKSAVTGDEISENKLIEDTQIIKQFMEACNNKNIEDAYNLLTDECKEEMFPNIDDFIEIYYLPNFEKQEKNFNIENWIKNTYKVTIIGDVISTGKIDETNKKQDYITIINKEDGYKLNINNYIGRKEINKETKSNNVNIKVEAKDIYMDYEMYKIVVENNSEKSILLDTGNKSNTIYLLDSNDMKYYFNNNILQNKLIINNGFKKGYRIKFGNSYSSTRKIDKMVFSNMVLNYDEFKNIENKDDYKYFCYQVDI